MLSPSALFPSQRVVSPILLTSPSFPLLTFPSPNLSLTSLDLSSRPSPTSTPMMIDTSQPSPTTYQHQATLASTQQAVTNLQQRMDVIEHIRSSPASSSSSYLPFSSIQDVSHLIKALSDLQEEVLSLKKRVAVNDATIISLTASRARSENEINEIKYVQAKFEFDPIVYPLPAGSTLSPWTDNQVFKTWVFRILCTFNTYGMLHLIRAKVLGIGHRVSSLESDYEQPLIGLTQEDIKKVTSDKDWTAVRAKSAQAYSYLIQCLSGDCLSRVSRIPIDNAYGAWEALLHMHQMGASDVPVQTSNYRNIRQGIDEPVHAYGERILSQVQLLQVMGREIPLTAQKIHLIDGLKPGYMKAVARINIEDSLSVEQVLDILTLQEERLAVERGRDIGIRCMEFDPGQLPEIHTVAAAIKKPSRNQGRSIRRKRQRSKGKDTKEYWPKTPILFFLDSAATVCVVKTDVQLSYPSASCRSVIQTADGHTISNLTSGCIALQTVGGGSVRIDRVLTHADITHNILSISALIEQLSGSVRFKKGTAQLLDSEGTVLFEGSREGSLYAMHLKSTLVETPPPPHRSTRVHTVENVFMMAAASSSSSSSAPVSQFIASAPNEFKVGSPLGGALGLGRHFMDRKRCIHLIGLDGEDKPRNPQVWVDEVQALAWIPSRKALPGHYSLVTLDDEGEPIPVFADLDETGAARVGESNIVLPPLGGAYLHEYDYDESLRTILLQGSIAPGSSASFCSPAERATIGRGAAKSSQYTTITYDNDGVSVPRLESDPNNKKRTMRKPYLGEFDPSTGLPTGKGKGVTIERKARDTPPSSPGGRSRRTSSVSTPEKPAVRSGKPPITGESEEKFAELSHITDSFPALSDPFDDDAAEVNTMSADINSREADGAPDRETQGDRLELQARTERHATWGRMRAILAPRVPGVGPEPRPSWTHNDEVLGDQDSRRWANGEVTPIEAFRLMELADVEYAKSNDLRKEIVLHKVKETDALAHATLMGASIEDREKASKLFHTLVEQGVSLKSAAQSQTDNIDQRRAYAQARWWNVAGARYKGHWSSHLHSTVTVGVEVTADHTPGKPAGSFGSRRSFFSRCTAWSKRRNRDEDGEWAEQHCDQCPHPIVGDQGELCAKHLDLLQGVRLVPTGSNDFSLEATIGFTNEKMTLNDNLKDRNKKRQLEKNKEYLEGEYRRRYNILHSSSSASSASDEGPMDRKFHEQIVNGTGFNPTLPPLKSLQNYPALTKEEIVSKEAFMLDPVSRHNIIGDVTGDLYRRAIAVALDDNRAVRYIPPLEEGQAQQPNNRWQFIAGRKYSSSVPQAAAAAAAAPSSSNGGVHHRYIIDASRISSGVFRFIGHSLHPNCQFIRVVRPGGFVEVRIGALTTINIGDLLTCNLTESHLVRYEPRQERSLGYGSLSQQLENTEDFPGWPEEYTQIGESEQHIIAAVAKSVGGTQTINLTDEPDDEKEENEDEEEDNSDSEFETEDVGSGKRKIIKKTVTTITTSGSKKKGSAKKTDAKSKTPTKKQKSKKDKDEEDDDSMNLE